MENKGQEYGQNDNSSAENKLVLNGCLLNDLNDQAVNQIELEWDPAQQAKYTIAYFYFHREEDHAADKSCCYKKRKYFGGIPGGKKWNDLPLEFEQSHKTKDNNRSNDVIILSYETGYFLLISCPQDTHYE